MQTLKSFAKAINFRYEEDKIMEQVLAPNWKFKTKVSDDDKAGPGEIKIRGLKEPSSARVKEIIEDDITELKAAIFQDTTMLKAMLLKLTIS